MFSKCTHTTVTTQTRYVTIDQYLGVPPMPSLCLRVQGPHSSTDILDRKKNVPTISPYFYSPALIVLPYTLFYYAYFANINIRKVLQR